MLKERGSDSFDAEIAKIAGDLIHLLRHQREGVVLHYSDEPDPASIELILHSAVAEKRESPQVDVRGRTDAPKAQRELPKERARENLPANYLCSLCENRMYPVRKYRKNGKLPILVLHYNGQPGSSVVRPDRSDRHIFGSEEEDDLFFRMCRAAGFEPDDFFFQEFPACHFGSQSGSESEWNLRMKNCLMHVKNTIEANRIRLLIFMGPSALLFFGKAEALRKSTSMEISEANIDGLPIPSLVLRSPAALLSMEKRRAVADEESRKRLTGEESAIKKAILESLKKCRALIQESGDTPTRDS
jgi:hypothetical protein